MDIIAAYREVGTYRGAAAICGVSHKTVRRVIERHNAGGESPGRERRGHNYDPVADLVAKRVGATKGRISAKRLLPEAVASGYEGSARNFRRVVADAKVRWRKDNHRGRRPGVWAPGQHLLIDWGVELGVHVFCAVLAWSRYRFVRFAHDERAETTLRLLAECFESLGGVPMVVLADRMGCLRAGVVANAVVPTGGYVRFAAHYRFRPDFCEAADPQSKGMVENLVGYAKRDLLIPQALFADLAAANPAAAQWCREVNQVRHAEVCAVPAERLAAERGLLGELPSLRPSLGTAIVRKVDRLSCVRYGSARYSVPTGWIGASVQIVCDAGSGTGSAPGGVGGRLLVLEPGTAEVLAEHRLVAPGEASILDEHYGGPRPELPARAVRAKTQTEKDFCALGDVAEEFIKGAAAAGNSRLAAELADIATLEAAHGRQALLAALNRAVAFGRFKAADVRSILAAGAGAPEPTEPGDVLILPLPAVPVRSLADYALTTDADDSTPADPQNTNPAREII
jgi:transposase